MTPPHCSDQVLSNLPEKLTTYGRYTRVETELAA